MDGPCVAKESFLFDFDLGFLWGCATRKWLGKRSSGQWPPSPSSRNSELKQRYSRNLNDARLVARLGSAESARAHVFDALAVESEYQAETERSARSVHVLFYSRVDLAGPNEPKWIRPNEPFALTAASRNPRLA